MIKDETLNSKIFRGKVGNFNGVIRAISGKIGDIVGKTGNGRVVLLFLLLVFRGRTGNGRVELLTIFLLLCS